MLGHSFPQVFGGAVFGVVVGFDHLFLQVIPNHQR
jgi:acid phosphatase family membrane protein YuiD